MNMADNEYSQSHDRIPNSANPRNNRGGPNRDRGNPQYNRGGPPRGGRGGRRGQGEYRGPNRPPAYTQVQQSDGDDSDLESWVSDSTTVGDIRSLDDFDDSVGRFGYKRGGRGGGRIRGSTPVRGQPMNTRFDDPTETNGNMKDGVGPASNRGRYQDGGNKKRNRNRKKQEKGNVDSGDVIKDCVDGMKKTKQINIIRLDDITTVDTKILINRVQSNSLKVEQLKEEGATKAELKERRKQIAIIQKEIKSRKENILESKTTTEELINGSEEVLDDEDSGEDPSESDDELEEDNCKLHHLPRKALARSLGKRMSFKPKGQKSKKKLATQPQVDIAQSEEFIDVETDTACIPTKNKTKPKKACKKTTPTNVNLGTKQPKMKQDTGNKNADSKTDLSFILSRFDDLIVGIGETVVQTDARQEEVPLFENSPSKKADDGNQEVLTNKPFVDISNEMFNFVVRVFHGKGNPNEIKRESGLFPVSLDAGSWFEISKRFNTVKRNDKVTTVFAFCKDISYCLDYIRKSGCSKELENKCDRFHVCKNMLCGNCIFGCNKCKFSHDFLDDRNIKVAKKLGLSQASFSNDEICTIMKMRYPHVCKSWVNNGTCDNEDNCSELHLCPDYTLGTCDNDDACPRCHDKLSSHNKPIVKAFNMEKWKDQPFKKMIFLCRTPKQQPASEKSSRPGMYVFYPHIP